MMEALLMYGSNVGEDISEFPNIKKGCLWKTFHRVFDGIFWEIRSEITTNQ